MLLKKRCITLIWTIVLLLNGHLSRAAEEPPKLIGNDESLRLTPDVREKILEHMPRLSTLERRLFYLSHLVSDRFQVCCATSYSVFTQEIIVASNKNWIGVEGCQRNLKARVELLFLAIKKVEAELLSGKEFLHIIDEQSQEEGSEIWQIVEGHSRFQKAFFIRFAETILVDEAHEQDEEEFSEALEALALEQSPDMMGASSIVDSQPTIPRQESAEDMKRLQAFKRSWKEGQLIIIGSQKTRDQALYPFLINKKTTQHAEIKILEWYLLHHHAKKIIASMNELPYFICPNFLPCPLCYKELRKTVTTTGICLTLLPSHCQAYPGRWCSVEGEEFYFRYSPEAAALTPSPTSRDQLHSFFDQRPESPSVIRPFTCHLPGVSEKVIEDSPRKKRKTALPHQKL